MKSVLRDRNLIKRYEFCRFHLDALDDVETPQGGLPMLYVCKLAFKGIINNHLLFLIEVLLVEIFDFKNLFFQPYLLI